MLNRSVTARTRALLLVPCLAAGILLLAASAQAGTPLATASDDGISVNVDQAKLVRLPDRVTTVVVGNPLIADVTLQPGNIIVVTGKGYGATNFIAMNRAGDVLLDRVIQVQGPTDQVITVYRGVDRESYSCMPLCQRRITLGDGETYFKSTMDQANTFNDKATAGSAKP
jgi:Flp pilus assembly secretin CpaC